MCKKTYDIQPQIFLKIPENHIFCNGYYMKSELSHIVGLLKNSGKNTIFQYKSILLLFYNNMPLEWPINTSIFPHRWI